MTGLARTYAALWAFTAACAAPIAAVPGAAHAARRRLDFAFAPTDGTPTEALALLQANGRVLLAVTVAAWAAGRAGVLRPILDLSVLLIAVVNVAIVGVAIGAYGPRSLAWLPHLPLEWGAFACALATYTHRRSSPGRLTALAVPIGAWATLLVLAALVESYLTAHTATLAALTHAAAVPR